MQLRRKSASAAVKLLAAALLAAAVSIAASAVPADAAIKVRTEDGRELVKYREVDCTRNRRGFFADHKAVRGWKFRLQVLGPDFSGFHSYVIRYGDDGPVDFSVFRRAGTSFSNSFQPQTDIPRLDVGGALHFPKRRKLIRIGFEITYDRVAPDPRWVSVNGQARCRYG